MRNDPRVMHDLDVLHDEHARERLALRRLERLAQTEERALERRLRELDEQHRRSASRLETEYRRTHYGKPSDSWPPHDDPER
jgi:hypothetical protein